MKSIFAIEKEMGLELFLTAGYGAVVKWILFGRCE